MIYLFLAEGFEEMEALATLDIMRRAGLKAQLVSVTDNINVTSSHKVTVKADILFEDCDFANCELMILPGGMPGASNLCAHSGLTAQLKEQNAEQKAIAAICAAPYVLGEIGILKGKKATCYPGFEKHLMGAEYTANLVEEDGNIITGKGPAAACQFGFTIVRRLLGQKVVDELKAGMLF